LYHNLVDHHSDFSYVHFQISTNAQETLAVKHAFEDYAKTHAVQVQCYHADNGRFAENLCEDCTAQHQGLNFTGVNAHFQNGRAEERIRDIQDAARTSLMHAHQRGLKPSQQTYGHMQCGIPTPP
jgi:hypothetical protein